MRRSSLRAPVMAALALAVLAVGAPAADADPLRPPSSLLGDLVDDTAGGVSDVVRDATEPITGTDEPVTGTVGAATDLVDDTTDRVAGTVDTATARATDTVGKVTDTVDETADTVEEVTGRATEAVTRTTRRVTDAVGSTTDGVTDTVEQVVDAPRPAPAPAPTPAAVATQHPPAEQPVGTAPDDDAHTGSHDDDGHDPVPDVATAPEPVPVEPAPTVPAPTVPAPTEPAPAGTSSAPAVTGVPTTAPVVVDACRRSPDVRACGLHRHGLEDLRSMPADIDGAIAEPPSSAPEDRTLVVSWSDVDQPATVSREAVSRPPLRLPDGPLGAVELALLIASLVGAIGYTVALSRTRSAPIEP